jgi:ribosomal subunit interface protein
VGTKTRSAGRVPQRVSHRKGDSHVDIIFKGRRTDVQERFRKHAAAKLSKIERLDSKTIRVDVEISAERNPRQSDRRERVELTIRSRGPIIRAEAAADDRYTALDRALAKLEARLRRSGDRRKNRHAASSPERDIALSMVPAGAVEPVSTGLGSGSGADGNRPAESAPGSGPALAGPALLGGDDVIPIQMEGDGPVVVREKFHTAVPMSIDQALLEMELVGHDFYLFRDDACGHPSVVYRRHGYQYGLIRLVEEAGADGTRQHSRRA